MCFYFLLDFPTNSSRTLTCTFQVHSRFVSRLYARRLDWTDPDFLQLKHRLEIPISLLVLMVNMCIS